MSEGNAHRFAQTPFQRINCRELRNVDQIPRNQIRSHLVCEMFDLSLREM
jgi:hypothetical protein